VIYLIPGPGVEGVKISEKKHAGHDSAVKLLYWTLSHPAEGLASDSGSTWNERVSRMGCCKRPLVHIVSSLVVGRLVFVVVPGP
jgi:hypothetical protein